MQKWELVIDARTRHGEGPSWSSREQTLYWVDLEPGRIHTYVPHSGAQRMIQLQHMVGAVAPRSRGGLVLALRDGFATLDLATETVSYLTRTEANRPALRFNDAKCDPAGRFLAGSMALDERKGAGTLYILDAQHRVRRLLGNRTISNGMAWSPDYGTYYYIDTPSMRVTAYDYDLETGNLSRARTAVVVPKGLGWPDGMTSDQEGMLWIAMWGGAAVTRWNPHTGELLEKIDLPAANVSSCCFGGPDLRDLYVTSARKDVDEETLTRYPLTGGLFRVVTGVIGMPTFEYAG